MPPKSNRTTRAKAKKPKEPTKQKSVEPEELVVSKEEVPEEPPLKSQQTQTEDEMVSKKLYDYKASLVKTLQEEKKKLETKLNALNEKLENSNKQNETKIQEYENRIKSLLETNEALKKNNAVKSFVLQRQVSSTSSKVSPTANLKDKGCKCKGNCGNKICGCVKKGISCQEFCKCDDRNCRNQEPDKENDEPTLLTTDEEQALQKFDDLTVTQKKAKPPVFGALNAKQLLSNTISNTPKRKLFCQDSDDIVDVGSAEISSPTEHASSSVDKKTQITRRVQKPVILSPATSSLILKHTRKHINQKTFEKADSEVLGGDKIPRSPVTPQKSENLPTLLSTKSPPGTQLQSRRQTTFGDGGSLSPHINIFDDHPIPKIDKIPRSPVRINISNAAGDADDTSSVGLDTSFVTMRNNRVDKIDQQPLLGLGNMRRSPRPDSRKVTPMSKKQYLLSSPRSAQSDDTNKSRLESALNPMVPRHQLLRSPVHGSRTASPVVNHVPPSQSRPSHELTQEEIDLEEFNRNLVTCNKCYRRFKSSRIELHEKVCKKI